LEEYPLRETSFGVGDGANFHFRIAANLFAVGATVLAVGQTPTSITVEDQPVLPVVRMSRDIGAPSPTEVLHVAVSLKPRNLVGLEQFASDVSNPSSPVYRQYMTPSQIGRTFGASQTDIDNVVAHLKANGFTIKTIAANRMAILADGTVQAAEKAFGTTIRNFTGVNPTYTEVVEFKANKTPVRLPLAIADKVVDVSGLEDYTQPVPRATTTQLNPNQIRFLYGESSIYVNPSMAGQGRTIGISNWDGFKLSNADLFIDRYALPYPAAGKHSNVKVISIDGGSMKMRAQGEGDLDIQMVLGTAPLSNVIVFDGRGGDLVNVLTTEANNTSVDIISESWGWNLPASTATAAHQQHLTMTASGKTYMAASGDNGTTLEPYSYPNYDPEVLMVGGTVATIDTTSGARVSEVAWSGGGGGWSTNTATFNVKPSWQTVSYGGVTANARWCPDVALHGDGGGVGGFFFYFGGRLYTGSGTSFSSPLFAGGLGVSQQKMLSTGRTTGNGRTGRLQDWIYSHASTAGLFYDITSGNNGNLPSGQASNATAGWDFCDGFGAMNFGVFANSY
jgi:subtilase family serine protease